MKLEECTVYRTFYCSIVVVAAATTVILFFNFLRRDSDLRNSRRLQTWWIIRRKKYVAFHQQQKFNAGFESRIKSSLIKIDIGEHVVFRRNYRFDVPFRDLVTSGLRRIRNPRNASNSVIPRQYCGCRRRISMCTSIVILRNATRTHFLYFFGLLKKQSSLHR